VGHDAGHNGVTLNRKIDSTIGLLVANLGSGISMGWWKSTHNVHHYVPNHIQHDPDVQHLPVLAVSDKFFSSLYSFYHERRMIFNQASRLIVSYQHIFFYPLMAVARFNLYLQSWMYMLFVNGKFQTVELALTTCWACWTFYFLSFSISWRIAVAVLLVSHIVAGILHVQIVLSHFPMETITEVPYKNDNEQWVDIQLKTTMDIDCPWWMMWFHGGLQHQTAHHLFPRVPRHNLTRLRGRVEEFCAKHGRKYVSASFFEGNRMMIANFSKAAAAARAGRFVKFEDTMIWEALNSQG